MAKSQGKQPKQDKEFDKLMEEEFGEKKKPETVHLGDTAALKRALDDAAVEALQEQGFKINHVITDSKIALGTLTCAFALGAQFWPGKFPDTKLPMAICIAMYCLLSVALTLFGMFVEKETFALTRAAPDQPSLVLRSSMPRFQENYTIAVRPRGTEPGCSEEAKLTSSVGAFFDSNGELAARVFKAEVVKMVECVQAGGAAQNGEAKKSQ